MKEAKWPYIIITKAKKVITWLVVTIIFWQWLLLYLLRTYLDIFSASCRIYPLNFFCQRENINVFRFYVSVQEICPSDLKAMHNALKSTEKVGCHTVCSCSKPGSRTDISTTKSCFDFRLVLFFLTKIQCYVTYFLAQ